MRATTLLTFALFLVAALSGCADSGSGDAEPQDTDTGTDDPTATETSTATQDETDDGAGEDPETEGDNETALGNATLTADVVNGTAPLTVNFTLDAELGGDETVWSLDLGDGNATNGTGLPATVAHTYNVTGNLTAVFTAGSGDAAVTDSLNLTVEARDDGPAMPEKLHWEFGPTVGCMEDLESTCQTYDSGPGADGPDGHWVQLGEAYWGLALVSTVDKGDVAGTGEWPLYDSDCFFTDADGNVVGDGHNGGGPCATEAIPMGAEWIYLYPYLTPALSMTMDVEVA